MYCWINFGDTRPPRIFETSDLTLKLESLLPNDAKVNTTIDDIRLRTKKTIIK